MEYHYYLRHNVDGSWITSHKHSIPGRGQTEYPQFIHNFECQQIKWPHRLWLFTRVIYVEAPFFTRIMESLIYNLHGRTRTINAEWQLWIGPIRRIHVQLLSQWTNYNKELKISWHQSWSDKVFETELTKKRPWDDWNLFHGTKPPEAMWGWRSKIWSA